MGKLIAPQPQLARIDTIPELVDENSLTFVMHQESQDQEEFRDNFSLESGISSILQIEKD